jgi:Fe-S oxidoreductase
VLYKNLENKGNPWGQNAKDRTNWIDEVDFDVPVYGKDVESFAGYEYLFWVGCAGAFEDRAKKTTKAVAELLATAGVKFLVLGEGETCNGDSARRSGNEFLFQQLAAQNVETLNDLFSGVERVDRKVVVTCPHCFNTLGREYPQVGGNYTVLHHTQLLNRLVRDKKLVPVKPADGGMDITYHDPCYLGRHNKEYSAPRELIGASGAKLTEMPRHADRGLCCGAGGARMWMEEHIGKRVNVERSEEAVDTGASAIATGCPFCRVMMTDGVDDVTSTRSLEKAPEVLDVAQLLLAEPVERFAARLVPLLPHVERPLPLHVRGLERPTAVPFGEHHFAPRVEERDRAGPEVHPDLHLRRRQRRPSPGVGALEANGGAAAHARGQAGPLEEGHVARERHADDVVRAERHLQVAAAHREDEAVGGASRAIRRKGGGRGGQRSGQDDRGGESIHRCLPVRARPAARDGESRRL